MNMNIMRMTSLGLLHPETKVGVRCEVGMLKILVNILIRMWNNKPLFSFGVINNFGLSWVGEMIVLIIWYWYKSVFSVTIVCYVFSAKLKGSFKYYTSALVVGVHALTRNDENVDAGEGEGGLWSNSDTAGIGIWDC